ncbi:MAG TPA: hypothetical protein VJ843_04450 [Candidatus Saccharimonadales bacterium]|nr:hypothetical protein [Candidatus Saccharimonadales bacterium]
MRLTTDGIKGDGHWMDRLVGGRGDATEVTPDVMEYEELIRAGGSAALTAEALYAAALEEQFGATAVAEAVEIDEQIAA